MGTSSTSICTGIFFRRFLLTTKSEVSNIIIHQALIPLLYSRLTITLSVVRDFQNLSSPYFVPSYTMRVHGAVEVQVLAAVLVLVGGVHQLQHAFAFAPSTPFLPHAYSQTTHRRDTAPHYSHTARITFKAAAKKSTGSEEDVDRSTFSAADDWLDAAVRSTLEKGGFDESSFLVGVLGDLHIDPRKMDEYQEGHDHWIPIFQRAKEAHGNTALVSLGDLGESKNCEHNPQNPSELFAGTTLCHEMAAEFLRSFDVPYEVIGGNHDLEGIDEFRTDQENLEVFMKAHGKPTPQFCREIADKTLLVGLGSTIFREAPYTSHEVIIDQAQIDWFENLLKEKPAEDGWKIFVFTHAPPNGSGLRVLQENHVVNGCCWLNHSNESQCRKFIELVREHRSIKAWFSGHFHLGQDYQDSITFPTIDPKEGPYPNRGSCVFVQTSVMRGGTSRDGRQQSRLLRGNKDGFEICTVDHQHGGKIRLDATITYKDSGHEVGIYMHDDEAYEHDKYFKVCRLYHTGFFG